MTKPQMNNNSQTENENSDIEVPDKTPAADSGEPTATDSNAADTWQRAQFEVPVDPNQTRFHDFDLPDALMHAIDDLGFKYCTPIQAEILPSTLAGRDAFGRAQTGTGKTAAFLISIITHLTNNPMTEKRKSGTPRVLIIAPTRELVMQVTEEAKQLAKHCDLNIIAIFGGMDFKQQQKQLTDRPADIVVATPGRLLDFSRRRVLNLKKVEVMVIDEADRMLDMGFIPDVRKIIYATPQKGTRQTMLFSATLTEPITRLAASWTQNPTHVAIEPEQVAVDSVDQIVYIVTSDNKFALLYNIIVQQDLSRVLVFCNRKDWVRRLADKLNRHGIKSQILTGDVPQEKRSRRLADFKSDKIRVLVATDVVARGIHIEAMDHVINYNLPHDPEDYVHRIGRTGRAGAAGTSISFADEEDSFYIPEIEEFMERPLPCTEPDDNWLILPQKPAEKKSAGRKKSPRRKDTGGKKNRSK
ncbi:MAG: DEAD/DEAH box helicase [Desulfobacterales bacterium]|nr:DEAD/DEAH box helicase [Desulfobacterales bacterium]